MNFGVPPGFHQCGLEPGSFLIRHHSLDHPGLEFPGQVHGDGLGVPPGFISVIGGLVADGTVQPILVVVPTPILQLFAGICKRQEPVGGNR